MAKVTRENLLARVRDLEWNHEASDTRYATHAIHRYSGKFIPQIARQAIELLTDPGERVLDPYCGSGTVPLEAMIAGRQGIGIDLNPLAVLISTVKTTPIPREALENFTEKLLSDLGGIGSLPQLQFNGVPPDAGVASDAPKLEQDFRWSDDWFRKWFPDESRRELIGILQAIQRTKGRELRAVALVAFSDVLRKSSNAHQGYPNVMFDRKRGLVPSPLRLFARRVRDVVDAVSRLSQLEVEHAASIMRADAVHLPIASDSIDAIVTHPPYIGSVPYAEYGALSLMWLGFDPRSLDQRLTGGQRTSTDVVDRFRQGFRLAIRECHRVLKGNGRMFMLVGSPTVKGARVSLSEMAKDLSQEVGMRLLTEESRVGTNRRANLMGPESLLFFSKT